MNALQTITRYFKTLKPDFPKKSKVHGLLFFVAVCTWLAAFTGYLMWGRSWDYGLQSRESSLIEPAFAKHD